jgi:hypothetical protein
MKTTVIVEDGTPVIADRETVTAAGRGDSATSEHPPIDAGAAPHDRGGEAGAPSANGASDAGPVPAWLLAAIALAGGLTAPAASGENDIDAGAGPA